MTTYLMKSCAGSIYDNEQDRLDREGPASTVIHLSTPELFEAINDEYSAILASERNNLPKALAIGDKLKALRPRAKHGEWRGHLAEQCPNLSYETATLYLRLYNNQAKLADAAAAKSVATGKSVDPTDLTIEDFRKYLAKSKADKGDSGPSKSKKAIKAAVEPAMDPKPASLAPDKVIKNLELDYGDMFEALKSAYEPDDLRELTQRLAAHLGMTLMPAANSDALKALLNMVEPALSE